MLWMLIRIRPDPAPDFGSTTLFVATSYYLEAVGFEPPDMTLVLDVQREVEHRRLGYHGTLGQEEEDTCNVGGTHRVPTPAPLPVREGRQVEII
jgi:hypothetical protein